MFIIIFGTVEEIKHISDKDRLERKKYMGLWRCELELTTKMISRFPITAIRYMDNSNPKKWLQFWIF
jgi:hypothetical protein